MFGLDRKQMEAERLARLSTKRKAASPPLADTASHVSPKRSRTSPPAEKASDSQPSLKQPELVSSTKKKSEVQKSQSKLRFPTATILRTHSPWHEQSPGTTFDSLIDKANLRTAVFSSFQWDLDWLFGKLDMKRTNMVLVMGVRTKQEEGQYQADMQSQGLKNVRLCFPPLAPEAKGHSVMHSKLMLLFYEQCMRIVVPTANLVAYDWGEAGGFMENTLFVIDLPRRTDGQKADPKDLPLFGRQLRTYLTRMGMQHNVLDGMLNFDYTPTSELGFVYSVYQETTPEQADVGVVCLRSTTNQLDLDSYPESIRIDYITATLGMLDDKLLNTVTAAASAGSSLWNGATPRFRGLNPEEICRIYFPTDRSVRASLGGPESAGTINAVKKLYNTSSFRKSVLRDFRSSRSGMLSHSKIMLVRGRPIPMQDWYRPGDWHSWVYVGSANMTASAWGSYTKKGFVCRNWECGVVVPGKKIVKAGLAEEDEEGSETEDEDDRGKSAIRVREVSEQSKNEAPALREMFDGILEFPMENDGDLKYGKDDRPWFFDER